MTEEQYEALMRNFSMDLGAMCITAPSTGVEHLEEHQRRDMLSSMALRPTLILVFTKNARLAAAAQRAREGEVDHAPYGGRQRLASPATAAKIPFGTIRSEVSRTAMAAGVTGMVTNEPHREHQCSAAVRRRRDAA